MGVFMETPPLDRPSVERIMVGELTIDKRYQRPADEKRVREYAANWREELCGALVVNRRRDSGRLVVVDGQHRLAAASLAGIESVACVIYDLPRTAEPRLFVDWQTQRRSVKPLERHRALVEAKDEEALAINRVLASHALPQFQQIVAAYDVYRRGGEQHLSEVLFIAKNAWPGDRLAFHRNLLHGISQVILAFGEKLNHLDFAQRLSANTPRQVLVKAKDAAEVLSQEASILSVSRVLVKLANTGRGGRILKFDDVVAAYGKRKTVHLGGKRTVAHFRQAAS